jgi:hypothetical protein
MQQTTTYRSSAPQRSVPHTHQDDQHGFDFDPPRSLVEAQERITQLRLECRRIKGQLAHSVRCGPDGEPLSPRAYSRWRSRAEYALQAKQAELVFVEAWLERKIRAADRALVEQTFMVDTGDTISLLGGLYQLVVHWIKEGDVELDPAEATFLDVVRHHLRDNLRV